MISLKFYAFKLTVKSLNSVVIENMYISAGTLQKLNAV
jgi:hypothetical protein